MAADLEEGADELLAVTSPLAGTEGWRRRRGEAYLAREEQRTLKKVVWNLEATAWADGVLVVVGQDHLGQHGLAGAWGTEEEEAAHGVTEHPAVLQGGKDVGEDHGEGDTVM